MTKLELKWDIDQPPLAKAQQQKMINKYEHYTCL